VGKPVSWRDGEDLRAAINVTQQGVPVALAFGEFVISSVVFRWAIEGKARHRSAHSFADLHARLPRRIGSNRRSPLPGSLVA
jgi:hypothetical protein